MAGPDEDTADMDSGAVLLITYGDGTEGDCVSVSVNTGPELSISSALLAVYVVPATVVLMKSCRKEYFIMQRPCQCNASSGRQ